VRAQHGFTLVETAIVVAVIALLVTAGAFTFANKPYALRSSATLFDSALAHARSIAETSGNGATVVVAARNSDRAVLYVYRGRPNDPASMSLDAPAIEIEASVTASTLGNAPYAFFIDGAGQVRAIGSYPPLTNGAPAAFPVLASPPPCDAPGYGVTLAAASGSEGRLLPCPGLVEGPPDAVPSP